MAIIKKNLQMINAGESVEKKEIVFLCWTECKLIQPLWRTVWRVLKKFEQNYNMTQQSHFWAYTGENHY